MKKKFLFLLFGVILGTVSCMAQNTLNIHQKTGGVASYAFSEKPVITYVGDNLHIETVAISIDYPVANVQKLTFEDSESSIGELQVKDDSSDILVYNLKGQLVKRVDCEDGISQLNIQDLPSGIYVVKNRNTTFKIVKK